MKARAVLCDDQSIDRQAPCLPVSCPFEKIRQELLKHSLHLKLAVSAIQASQLLGQRAICLCLDVESLRVDPRRPTQNPRLGNAVGLILHEILQQDVSRSEVAFIECRTRSWVAGLVQLDGSHFECKR